MSSFVCLYQCCIHVQFRSRSISVVSLSQFSFFSMTPVFDLVTVFVETNSFLFPTPKVCLHWVLLPTPSRKSVLCLLSAPLVTKWLQNVPFHVTIVTVGGLQWEGNQRASLKRWSTGHGVGSVWISVCLDTVTAISRGFKLWQRRSVSFKENGCVMTRA